MEVLLTPKGFNQKTIFKFGNLCFVLLFHVCLKGLVVLLLGLVRFQRMDHLGPKEKGWLGINSAGTEVPTSTHFYFFFLSNWELSLLV